MKKFCSNCQSWQESWADYPNHRSYSAYRRYERCLGCDEWTLSGRTIFIPSSSQISRDEIQGRLDNVRMGRIGGFACIKEEYVSGERVRETLMYDGGGTYTRIIDRGGREVVETRELQTFVENFFLEIMDAVTENPLLLCTVS